MKRTLIAAGIIAASAGGAWAHPGEHGFSLAGSLYHLLTEPDHLALLVFTIAIVSGLIYKLKRRSV